LDRYEPGAGTPADYTGRTVKVGARHQGCGAALSQAGSPGTTGYPLGLDRVVINNHHSPGRLQPLWSCLCPCKKGSIPDVIPPAPLHPGVGLRGRRGMHRRAPSSLRVRPWRARFSFTLEELKAMEEGLVEADYFCHQYLRDQGALSIFEVIWGMASYQGNGQLEG
jgi:hypothetical protein